MRNIPKRIEGLRRLMTDNNLDAVLVTKKENLQYFSGFRGDSAVLIVTKKELLLVTDGRYTEQATHEAPSFMVVCHEDGLLKKTAAMLNEVSARSIGFEGGAILYNDCERLANFLDKGSLALSLKLDTLREIKDEEEIAKIKKASEITSLVFEDVLNFLRPGITENLVAAHMEYKMRELGADGAAFPTIVASGKRSSLPHAVPTEKLILEGEFVTMDFGATYEGYASDMTRTVVVGRATSEERRIYEAVREAQSLGLRNILPQKSGKEVDKIVRDFLETCGLAQYFLHSLGHSLGLEIHEEPRLSRFSTCEHLQKNMVLTCEPGVYIKGFGGVRIEDTVLVAEEPTPLTFGEKKLLEL